MASKWIASKYRLPEQEGIYLVYAASADPDRPLIVTAFWSNDNPRGWLGLVEIWAKAISHWQPLPSPPSEESR